MALSRVKTWIAGEVLTASDLNAEFNNLLNNARDLVSPLTGVLDMNGFELIMDGDADSSLTADTDDRLDVRLGGVDLFTFDGTTASLVNGLTFTGAVTGSGASVASTGSDTNIPVTLKGKGTGAVILGQSTSTDVRLAADQPIADSAGNELFKFAKTASAVNEVTVTNAATGNPPILSATGGDTNIPLRLTPKGTGVVQFTDGTDVSKVLALALSGLTTATTRTLTIPDASTTLVGTDVSQTLTNKTLTSPTVNTPTVTSPTINTGVSQGSGAKHQRFGATNATAATTASTADTTYSWTTPFANASYTPVAIGIGAASTSISVLSIVSFDANGVSVRVTAGNAVVASFTAVHIIALHD